MADNIFFILEIIGTIAFAVSGAVLAVKKEADIFGVLFLGIITAVGGGILRDIMLGALPPRIFTDSVYVLVASAVSLTVFLFAVIFYDKYTYSENRIDRINNIFDAVGLGVFSVYGMIAGIEAGYGDNGFFVIFLGMTTGIGGGIIRDTLVKDMPFVLRKRIYAVASLSGCLLYYMLYRLTVDNVIAAFIGMAAVFALRMLATKYKWNLPAVKQGKL